MRAKYLMLSVFVAGLTSLGAEMAASRLLGNVYGTSNIVWANIIGLILVYLSAGYFIGGRWADRSPHRVTFYRLMAWAAFTIGLVPMVSRPVLRQAVAAVEQLDAAVMLGSFLSVLVLFIVPITLLGCVSPFAIRLAISDTREAGRTSGRIYAVSTLGSIVGTFIPILWLIPAIGTARTFLALAYLLLFTALAGLGLADWRAMLRLLWMPLALAGLAWWALTGPIKESGGQVFETESSYNYIQVVERGGTRYLLLNEGQGIHSVYNPEDGATYGTWDCFLAAPFLNPPPVALSSVERLGIVGLAGGTIAKQYTQVFGPIPIDGWEIDPEIVEVGRRYFDMNEPNLNVVVADGRWGLAHSPRRYSVIAVDAYRLPYIPWQLTTREFFEEVRKHLLPDGVLVINVGRTPQDRQLVEAMVGTLRAVFPSVHVVDVPNTFNTIVFGTVQETTAANLEGNYRYLLAAGAPSLLLDVLARAQANLQPTPESSIVFTDDWAPIEQLTNAMAIRFILHGDVSLLR
ncbi:MAG: fused MFS/spermidine synthase [Chloroflexota bacterium]